MCVCVCVCVCVCPRGFVCAYGNYSDGWQPQARLATTVTPRNSAHGRANSWPRGNPEAERGWSNGWSNAQARLPCEQASECMPKDIADAKR